MGGTSCRGTRSPAYDPRERQPSRERGSMAAGQASVAVVGGGLGGLAARPACSPRAGTGSRSTTRTPGSAARPRCCTRAASASTWGRPSSPSPASSTASSPRPGRDLNAYLDLRRLDPQWRCFFDDGAPHRPRRDRRPDGGRHGPLRARHAARARATAPSSASPRICTTSPNASSSGSRSRTCSTRSTSAPTSTPRRCATCSRCAWARSVAGTIRGRVKDARLAQMLDHFIQYVGSSPYGSPGRALRHRPHAGRGGALVSDRRHAGGASRR